MPIIVSEGKSRVIHLPPQENIQAVCFDVWDLGRQQSDFKGESRIQHKLKIGFELEARIESNDDFNGKRFKIFKDYTHSLSKKSNLRKDLTAWRGKAFTDEELAGFDLDNLIGANCLLNIIHYQGQDGQTRAKISAISQLPKGMVKITPDTGREIPQWIADIQAKAVPETATAEVGE